MTTANHPNPWISAGPLEASHKLASPSRPSAPIHESFKPTQAIGQYRSVDPG
jgi:hypothetical protein